MPKIFLVIFNLVICVVIYFGITAVLILVVQPTKPNPEEGNLAFNELFIDYSNLPQLKTFTARDVKQLGYRHYPAQSDKVVILLHGSGWHSQYFLPLAEFISSECCQSAKWDTFRTEHYAIIRRH